MLDALILRMTGQAPGERSGDSADDRRSGYVNFQDVVSAIKLANEPLRDQIQSLTDTLRREVRAQTSALAQRLEDHEHEAHARDERIAALEQWRKQEEVDEAFRRGFWHVAVMLFGWLVNHWPAMLAVGATIVGVVWALTNSGTPVVQVQP